KPVIEENRSEQGAETCSVLLQSQPAASAADRLHARHAPADDGRFDRGAGLLVAPLAVNIEAGKGKFVSTAMIFAQNLDRLAGRGGSMTIELCQPFFSGCHSTIS